jgi:deoxycytidylate deaminase
VGVEGWSVSDLRKIRVATDAATLSRHTKYRLGAGLFRGSRLISTGVNQIKTHTKSPHSYRMIHAEIDALLRVDQEAVDGSSLFVVRILKNMRFACSKPCDCCWEMASRLGVKRIVYFDESGFVSETIR